MEFGKIENIQNINWELPEDDPKNKTHLIFDQSQEKVKESKLFFGAPAWGSKHWLGKIYPEKTSSKDFLHYYSRNFTCIELNTTHYRIPDEKTTHDWLIKVPETFLFCPKVTKEISHERNGLTDKVTLHQWIQFMERMGTNLGPCFIQLSEFFSYHEKALLFKFMESWPSEFRLNLELRHPSWFQNGVILPALSDYLHKKNLGLVITDVAGRRDVLHSSLSAPYSMIRLIGNNLDPSDGIRASLWADRIKSWQNLGKLDTFLFLHQPDDVKTIEFTELTLEIFKSKGFTNTPHLQMHTPLNFLPNL